MSHIKVTISKTGMVTIDVLDAVGPHCSLLTKQLEEALGEVTLDELKPEFFESQPTHHDTIQH